MDVGERGGGGVNTFLVMVPAFFPKLESHFYNKRETFLSSATEVGRVQGGKRDPRLWREREISSFWFECTQELKKVATRTSTKKCYPQ